MIDGFKIKPQDYKIKIDEMVTLISSNKDNATKAVDILQGLVNLATRAKPRWRS